MSATPSLRRSGAANVALGLLFVAGGLFLLVKLYSLKAAVKEGRAAAERSFNPPAKP